MKRREFLEGMAAAPAAAARFHFPARRTGKPNLLFLWTDQQRPDTMSVYGNSKIRVPNLNKLADESVVFQKAYVSQPVCTPSRSTVMTGLWPHTSGCRENNVPLPPEVRCLPEILSDPDYRTGYFGKWHLGDEVFAQHGFQEWESTEEYLTHFSPGRDAGARSSYDRFLRTLGYKPEMPDNKFSRSFAARLPLEHCKPKFLETRACEFLRRNRMNPFMLYVNFLEPHSPYFGPLDNEYKAEEMELPENFSDPLEKDEPFRYRLLRQRQQRLPLEGHDFSSNSGWKKLIANYWGLVTQVDRSIGGILRTVEDLGLAENTIVAFTSDHGEMLGAHRMRNKCVMYEESLRIPWLLRIPRVARRRQLLAGRFSHIDLIPTLLDLLGKPAADRFPGRSLMPSIKGDCARRNPVHVEWNPFSELDDEFRGMRIQDEPSLRALRSHTRTVITQDGWKLCLSDADKSQLFNLEEDPWERHNLFYTGRRTDVIRKLAGEIERWQQRTGDRVSVRGAL